MILTMDLNDIFKYHLKDLWMWCFILNELEGNFLSGTGKYDN
jgi:hypothetical protein